MTKTLKQVTLRHILDQNKKFIGLQFYLNKVINALTKELSNVTWSNEHDMFILLNNSMNLNAIFTTFKGVA